MRFDAPELALGADGGHGPVGYRVEHHELGRSVTFSFTDRPRGLVGRHQYVVQATGSERCTLWHLTHITPRGLLRFTWVFFWAPLHNALIEDSLYRAGTAVAVDSGARKTWSLYVRALRALSSVLNLGSAERVRSA